MSVGPHQLPDDHLSLVIEDALAAVTSDSAEGAHAERRPDLRAAVLYGWCLGAMSARELASRAESDAELHYLLAGSPVSFADVRAYRETNRARLEADFAAAFRVCRAAGFARLGRIDLDAPTRWPRRRPDEEPESSPPNPFAPLARRLLLRAALADEREDSDVRNADRGSAVPPGLTARSVRQAAFRTYSAERSRQDAEGPVVSRVESLPDSVRSRAATLASYLSAVVALVVLVAGLVLVRWVGGATFPEEAEASVSEAIPEEESAPPADAEEPDLVGAYEEAMRLGLDALAGGELTVARDLFFLARQAAPEDAAAEKRLHQVETALRVAEPEPDWTKVLDDLEALTAVAPDADAILHAYASALVRAGRNRLGDGEPDRALALCGEAVRLLSDREDAQSCVAQTRLVAAATATAVAASPWLAPSPTRTLVPPTVTPIPTATRTPTPAPATVAPVFETP